MVNTKRIDLTFYMDSDQNRKIYNFLHKVKRRKTQFVVQAVEFYLEMLDLNNVDQLSEEDVLKIALNFKPASAFKKESPYKESPTIIQQPFSVVPTSPTAANDIVDQVKSNAIKVKSESMKVKDEVKNEVENEIKDVIEDDGELQELLDMADMFG